MRVYLAGPLFTQAEWHWNAAFASALREKDFDVYLPQERAEPMLNAAERFDPELLFHNNIVEIERADVVLAVLDQPDPDSGTCWECGYAFKLGIPIVGLRTDLRQCGDDDNPERPVNLMLARSCAGFVRAPFNRREDMTSLVESVAKALNAL
jgi:nucleoside 2-deoxyribosyltransferase